MQLRTEILSSVLGITIFAQVVFGMLAYQQITEDNSNPLTILFQYFKAAEQLTLSEEQYVSETYIEELRRKFSAPNSSLIIQKNNKIIHSIGDIIVDFPQLSQQLKAINFSRKKHGSIYFNGDEYYWITNNLPDKNYQLIILELAANKKTSVTTTLTMRLLSISAVILWLAIWIGLLLSNKISKKLDKKNNQLKRMALHDSLTGLPNRQLLNDRLEQLFLQSQRENLTFALFLIDLDRFKEVNDTLGHHFGDELLKMVSTRLLSLTRGKDSISRLGGDEFAVLLPQTNLDDSMICAERIINAMNAPFSINNISTESKASIGIALYPEHGNNADTLMAHADIAMYQAKKSQAGFAVYDPSQNEHSVRRLKLMSDLRTAIENKKIYIAYQPLISCNKSTINSVEVLARWQHDELGHISPDEFIPMAEQMGLIRLLTLQIFKQAIDDCKKWHKQGHTFGINVNISTCCLQDFSLPDEITALLKNTGLDTRKIELEITETALMHDLSRAGKILNKLSDAGLKLAIDDFGTGFSSLNYLKNLPVDTLKIDKSFIMDMHNSSNDHAIVKTIIELGHNLNCQVVAEGVENQQIIDSLKLLDIDILQGFFYSKPLEYSDLQDWLIKNITLTQAE